MDQVVKALRDTVVDPTYADFNEQIIDGSKLLMDEAIGAFETLPFFSEKRLVVIKQVPWFGTTKSTLSELDEEKLLGYMENPCPTSVVVLLCDAVDKRKKIGKMLQKQGALFEFGKLDETELKKILLGKLNNMGCRISQENLQYCIYLLGYLEKDADRDLYEVLGQVERIASASDGEISKELLTRMLEKPLDTNIFAYMDAISEGKTHDAIRIKQQLLSEDFNEIQINAMLFKHFRNLYKTVLWLNKGYNATAIAEKIGVHPFSAKKYTSQCRQFRESYLKQVVIDLAELDYRMKTGKISFEQALDLMTVCLSQKMPLPLNCK
jgi:DNA polymerase-3 subunit delta